MYNVNTWSARVDSFRVHFDEKVNGLAMGNEKKKKRTNEYKRKSERVKKKEVKSQDINGDKKERQREREREREREGCSFKNVQID